MFFFFKYIKTNSISQSTIWDGAYWEETYQKQVLLLQLTLAPARARYLSRPLDMLLLIAFVISEQKYLAIKTRKETQLPLVPFDLHKVCHIFISFTYDNFITTWNLHEGIKKIPSLYTPFSQKDSSVLPEDKLNFGMEYNLWKLQTTWIDYTKKDIKYWWLANLFRAIKCDV